MASDVRALNGLGNALQYQQIHVTLATKQNEKSGWRDAVCVRDTDGKMVISVGVVDNFPGEVRDYI